MAQALRSYTREIGAEAFLLVCVGTYSRRPYRDARLATYSYTNYDIQTLDIGAARRCAAPPACCYVRTSSGLTLE